MLDELNSFPFSKGNINIEIKARSSNHSKVREVLKSLNADFKGVDHQTDTYFNVKNGRLKLREGNIENHLIYYNRKDNEGPKQSNVLLYKSDPESSLKEILAKALGILVIVKKQREIFFIDNVKFHIDTIKNLGTFVEIEAIDKEGNIGKDKLLEQTNFYMNMFKIPKDDLIAVSYSDMLFTNKAALSSNSF